MKVMPIGTLPPGTQGGDSDTHATSSVATALRQVGVRFLIRYLSRFVPQNVGDISLAERQTILKAGLAIGYVQHYPGNGWIPSASRGTSYATSAVEIARAIGIPPGVCIWRDWEGLVPQATNSDCIADMNAWSRQILNGNYIPGLYVGYNSILSASDLYWRLICKHYWKSASRVPAPEIRGYQLIQSLAPSPITNYDWDRDVITTDNLGGTPVWDLPS